MFREVPIARSLRLAFGGGLAGIAFIAMPALAQTNSASDVQKGDRVEVTGSSIKRIDAETSLPVQVLNRQDIDRLNPQNTEDLLRSISATNSLGGTQLSSGSGATTGGLSAVSLRGLGSQRTLVLINGRRISPYGGAQADFSVDINSIPLAAIERVEVLKDGASAIYGSDAIAGVINFILRNDFQGALIEAQYGATTHAGDGKSYYGDVVLGFGDVDKDRFNAMVTASFNREDAIFGAQRKFANSNYHPATGSDTTSSNTYPANIDSPNGVYNFDAPPFAGKYPTFGFTACNNTYAFVKPGASRCAFDPAPLVSLIPENERSALGFHGRFKVSDALELYGEANGQHNVVKTQIQPVPISEQFSLQSTNPYYGAQQNLLNGYQAQLDAAYYPGFTDGLRNTTVFLLPTNSPYYPTAFAAANGAAGLPLDLRYRAAESGNRSIRDVNDSDRFVIGARGTFRDIDYDVGFLYTQTRNREGVLAGYPQESLLLPLLDSGVVNPFGPSTPAVRQQILAANFTGQAFESTTSLLGVNGHVSKEIFKLPAGSIALALGGELRREQYFLTAATPIQSGDVSGYGGNFLNQADARNVEAAFYEISVPITKTLEFDTAGRYDNYEGTGNTFNPKASIRWQPVKEVLFRGSWGTGFRAPSLADIFGPVTQGVTGVTDDPVRCPVTGGVNDCQVQYTQINGGNRSLTPEKSISKTLGIILEPNDSVHLGVDYFDTFVRNTIGVIDVNTILNNQAQYAGSITRAPQTAADIAAGLPGRIISINQQLQNTNNLHINGFDFDAKFRTALPIGRLTAGLSGTYFTKYDIQNPDLTYSSAVAVAQVIGVVPRYKQIASLSYDYGSFSGSLIQNFQTAYQDYQTGNDRKVGVYETYDFQASYSGFKGVGVTLGIKNLFDRDPPYSNGSTDQFQGGYDPSYADPRGRFLYGKISYRFK